MSRRPSNIFKKTLLPGLLTVALALSLVFSDGILPIPADLHGEPVTYQLFILIGIVLVAAFVIDDFFQEREPGTPTCRVRLPDMRQGVRTERSVAGASHRLG
jgi:hypothetical protein